MPAGGPVRSRGDEGGGVVSREDLLERIRLACRDAAGDLPPLPAPQVFEDTVALFISRARDLGVRVLPVASVHDAADRAASWCAEQGIRRAAAWATADLDPIVERLRAAGVRVLSPGASTEELAQAQVGLTGAAWGIAETATLVLPSGPDQPRGTSLLPPLHLAVLRADRILPDLAALFGRCGPLPSALTLITGPSRSADIGLVPVLGAHGPTEVRVLLVAG